MNGESDSHVFIVPSNRDVGDDVLPGLKPGATRAGHGDSNGGPPG